MSAHRLADLRRDEYRAGALESAVRGMLDQSPLVRKWSAQSARELMAEIEAARTLSPAMFDYEPAPAEPFEVRA